MKEESGGSGTIVPSSRLVSVAEESNKHQGEGGGWNSRSRRSSPACSSKLGTILQIGVTVINHNNSH